MKTGGLVINDEEFNNDFFMNNFDKYFGNILNGSSVYGCTMQIMHTDSVYIQGIIGCCALKDKPSGYAKDQDIFIGEYGGLEYVLNCPLKTSTYLINFGLSKNTIEQTVKSVNFQIHVKYYHSDGT